MEKEDVKDKEDKKAAEDLFSAHDFDITIELGKYLLTLEIPVMCSLLKVNLNLSHFIIVKIWNVTKQYSKHMVLKFIIILCNVDNCIHSMCYSVSVLWHNQTQVKWPYLEAISLV